MQDVSRMLGSESHRVVNPLNPCTSRATFPRNLRLYRIIIMLITVGGGAEAVGGSGALGFAGARRPMKDFKREAALAEARKQL